MYITVLMTIVLLMLSFGCPFDVAEGEGKAVTVAVTTIFTIGVEVAVSVARADTVAFGVTTAMVPVGIGVNVAGKTGVIVWLAPGVLIAENGVDEANTAVSPGFNIDAVGVSSGDARGDPGVLRGLTIGETLGCRLGSDLVWAVAGRVFDNTLSAESVRVSWSDRVIDMAESTSTVVVI